MTDSFTDAAIETRGDRIRSLRLDKGSPTPEGGPPRRRAPGALMPVDTVRIPFVGGDLSAEVSGRGPPLLLLHSINAAASNAEMMALARELSDDFRVYNLDLPGFGASERPKLRYDVRRFVAAIEAATAHILKAEQAQRLDAIALSLTCEFLARAAVRQPELMGTLTLISPTGFQTGAQKLTEHNGATFEMGWLSFLLGLPVGPALYKALTIPASIRFFLRRTFGSQDIDRHVYEAALAASRQPGAEHAPLAFISGRLFSRDITTVYQGLTHPVLLAHGVRGAFSDFSNAGWTEERANWRRQIYPTGAMPQVELPSKFADDVRARLSAAQRAGA